MKEVKPSKKPLAIYYAIVLAVLLLLNLVLLPWMSERQVEEVDYGTFMTMTEEKNIGRVDIESNQIIFTDKEEKQVYKTGLMNDPELTQRLYDAGAQFSSEIVEQGSPMLNFLIWFLLPILLFSFIISLLFEGFGEEPITAALSGMGIFQPMLTALVGLVPNCAVSVLLAQLYVQGAISFGSLFAGLTAGAGVGLAVLWRVNPSWKQNLFMTGLLWAIGAAVGMLLQILPI